MRIQSQQQQQQQQQQQRHCNINGYNTVPVIQILYVFVFMTIQFSLLLLPKTSDAFSILSTSSSNNNIHTPFLTTRTKAPETITTGRNKRYVPTTLSLKTILLFAVGKKGFGASSSSSSSSSSSGKSNNKKKSNKLIDTLNDSNGNDVEKNSKNTSIKKTTSATRTTYIKSEQEELLTKLALQSSTTCIGQAVIKGQKEMLLQDPNYSIDPFWDLIPSLVSSKFPTIKDNQLHRIAGFIQHSINPSCINTLIDNSIEDFNIQYRPQLELHAYMPNLGKTQPYINPTTIPLCQLLIDNYDTILKEYETLINYFTTNPIANKQYGYQSITAINYSNGFTTLVLFYNGHRIKKFPYELCPVTTKLLETVPIAGRIAGFNCQNPNSGIPIHTDGNNMWLTCQMGLIVPDNNDNNTCFIHVDGPILENNNNNNNKYYWKERECVIYDTTYKHYTENNHTTQSRIVVHVDFFNTIKLTSIEIQILQYIYTIREQFLIAEGNTKALQQRL